MTPVTSSKAKDAAGRAGLRPAAGVATLRVEGADKPGLGAKITRAIADAGINARGVSAAVIGNRFVAYIGFDSDADADNAAAALKQAKLNGAARKPPKSRPGKKKPAPAPGRTRAPR